MNAKTEYPSEVKDYLEGYLVDNYGRLQLLADSEHVGEAWREMVATPNEKTFWKLIEEVRFGWNWSRHSETLSEVAWSLMQIQKDPNSDRTLDTISRAKSAINDAWELLRELEGN